MPARVLVTGASGFLGPYVCAALLHRGYHVRSVVRRTAVSPPTTETVLIAGLEDAPGLAEACDGVSAVVHLAGRAHVMRDEATDKLAAFRKVNVEGTRVVLESAIRSGARQFIFVSSVKAVGESNESPWQNDSTPAPSDPYGISKLEAERLVLEQTALHGVQGVVVRLPMAYGARVKGNMLRLVRLVNGGVPLPLGAITNRRSLVFAGNVGWAIAAGVESASLSGRTFFLSDGEDLSSPELVRRIAGALGRRPRLVAVPIGALKLAGRVGDALANLGAFPLTTASVQRLTSSLTVDSSEFARVAGPMPFSVDQGLAELASWFRRATS